MRFTVLFMANKLYLTIAWRYVTQSLWCRLLVTTTKGAVDDFKSKRNCCNTTLGGEAWVQGCMCVSISPDRLLLSPSSRVLRVRSMRWWLRKRVSGITRYAVRFLPNVISLHKDIANKCNIRIPLRGLPCFAPHAVHSSALWQAPSCIGIAAPKLSCMVTA